MPLLTTVSQNQSRTSNRIMSPKELNKIATKQHEENRQKKRERIEVKLVLYRSRAEQAAQAGVFFLDITDTDHVAIGQVFKDEGYFVDFGVSSTRIRWNLNGETVPSNEDTAKYSKKFPQWPPGQPWPQPSKPLPWQTSWEKSDYKPAFNK